MTQLEKTKTKLSKNQKQAMNNLLNDIDYLFATTRQEIETICSFEPMHSILDVFLNLLKENFHNYKEEF